MKSNDFTYFVAIKRWYTIIFSEADAYDDLRHECPQSRL